VQSQAVSGSFLRFQVVDFRTPIVSLDIPEFHHSKATFKATWHFCKAVCRGRRHGENVKIRLDSFEGRSIQNVGFYRAVPTADYGVVDGFTDYYKSNEVRLEAANQRWFGALTGFVLLGAHFGNPK
jgi:hypothetical protein